MTLDRKKVLDYFGFTCIGIPEYLTKKTCVDMYNELKRNAEEAQTSGLLRAMHTLTEEARMYKALSQFVDE
jgi:hypothetical protein